MSVHGWRVIVAATCLVGLAQGCQVPPLPAHAPPQSHREGESGDTDKYDGWLFKKLTGREAADSQSSARSEGAVASPPGGSPTSAGNSVSGVQQTSGIESAPGADGLRQLGTVLPPAGVADPKPKPKDDENSGFDWSDLYPSTIYKKVQAAVGLGPDERIARAAFKDGEALYREKKYAEAAKYFKTAADRWPDTPLEEDALFLLAECQFFSDQYSKALDTYGTLLKKHEYSRHLDKAVAREFAIGRFWEQMDTYEPHWPLTPNFLDKNRPMFDTWGHAIKAYENVRLSDPTGPLADHAVMAAADAYFVRGRYEDAALNYDLLRKEYPKSQHLVNASILGMRSKLEMYHGPMYDGKPLQEANKIAEQSLTQFPDRLGAEKDRIVQAKNQMVEQLAERDWAMGQYYERRGYYGAARYYYQIVMKDHAHTHFAERAKARLEEIKDKPAKPPDYFKWIDDVLPSKRYGSSVQGPRRP